MQDILSVLLALSFLALSMGYVALCARLRGGDEL